MTVGSFLLTMVKDSSASLHPVGVKVGKFVGGATGGFVEVPVEGLGTGAFVGASVGGATGAFVGASVGGATGASVGPPVQSTLWLSSPLPLEKSCTHIGEHLPFPGMSTRTTPVSS